MPPDILRYTPPADRIADSRMFLRSATPLRTWLLPNLRLMDRKMDVQPIGGVIAAKTTGSRWFHARLDGSIIKRGGDAA